MVQNLNITNASPRGISPGIRDASIGEVPFTPEQTPQHCPLFMAQSPLGTENVVLTTGADLLLTHGSGVLDQRSKFYSHQTHGMKRCNEQANLFYFKRLVHADAKKATTVIFLDIIKDEALPYDRDVNGTVIVNAGVKQTTGTVGTDEEEIFKIKLTSRPLADGEDINNLPTEVSELTSAINGETGTKYPILAISHADKGEGGNNFGFNLFFPHEASANPGDIAVMEEYNANLYRMRLQSRVNERSTPSVIDTTLGFQNVDIPLGEDMTNNSTNTTYSDVNAIEFYEADIPGSVTRPAPFGDFVVYNDNIALIQALISPVETTLSGKTVEDREVNFINEFNRAGKDQYGVRFTSDSLVFKTDTVHYLSGGADGDVNEATLNTLVQDFINNDFDDPASPLSSILEFPFSDIYDTGFDVDTKNALLTVMGKRPDVFVSVCTQDLALPINDAATEYSMGSALYSSARLIPESVQYGTPACRAAIFSQVGKVTAADHVKKPVYPLIMDVITKRSAYMGAADGEMKSGLGYDSGSNRNVSGFGVKSITNTWKNETAYFADWLSGINSVRMIDRQTAFWPAMQTVYSNDTSVLNSDINMHICCDIIRQQHRQWAIMSWNEKLTEQEFLDQSRQTLVDLLTNRYDERITTEVRSYKTAADTARGYSYTTDVNVYMNNAQTVNMLNITARRAADLQA